MESPDNLSYRYPDNLSYRYPQLWFLLAESLKEMNSLSQFKINIKHWTCSDCPSRLYKVFIQSRSGTKSSRLESGCELRAEEGSLQ